MFFGLFPIINYLGISRSFKVAQIKIYIDKAKEFACHHLIDTNVIYDSFDIKNKKIQSEIQGKDIACIGKLINFRWYRSTVHDQKASLVKSICLQQIVWSYIVILILSTSTHFIKTTFCYKKLFINTPINIFCFTDKETGKYISKYCENDDEFY